MPIRTSAGSVATHTPETLHTSSMAGTPLSRGVSAGLVLGVARNLGWLTERPADRVKRSSLL
jgi:hypothetical protein